MNHVYAKQGINSIVTGSDTGSGITYSTMALKVVVYPSYSDIHDIFLSEISSQRSRH